MNLINNTTAISRNIRENVQQSREFNEKISGLFNFISNGKTALMIAISKGNTEVALKLIEKGADIDFANNKGETALMLAISKRNAEVALKIIEISKKADMGFENKNINLISAANEMLKIKDSKKADLIEKDMKKIEKIFGQKFSMIDKNKLENNVRKPPLCFAHTGVIKKDGVNNINLKRKPIQLVSSSVVQTKKHEVNNSLTVNNPNIGGKRKKL